MAPRKLFGSLWFEGNVASGENPNGMVTQTSNGTWINGKGGDGVDIPWGLAADGRRWNPTLQVNGTALVEAVTLRPLGRRR
jgi:hypothetical protein